MNLSVSCQNTQVTWNFKLCSSSDLFGTFTLENSADMASVEFYEKLKGFKEDSFAREQQRITLETQLNALAKSDDRLARLNALRLQNYWKKICEDERRSQWRNEQLLKDVERVENQMAAISQKTDKLRQMKKQYEEHIDRTYPGWKEQILAHEKRKVAQVQMQEQARQQAVAEANYMQQQLQQQQLDIQQQQQQQQQQQHYQQQQYEYKPPPQVHYAPPINPYHPTPEVLYAPQHTPPVPSGNAPNTVNAAATAAVPQFYGNTADTSVKHYDAQSMDARNSVGSLKPLSPGETQLSRANPQQDQTDEVHIGPPSQFAQSPTSTLQTVSAMPSEFNTMTSTFGKGMDVYAESGAQFHQAAQHPDPAVSENQSPVRAASQHPVVQQQSKTTDNVLPYVQYSEDTRVTNSSTSKCLPITVPVTAKQSSIEEELSPRQARSSPVRRPSQDPGRAKSPERPVSRSDTPLSERSIYQQADITFSQLYDLFAFVEAELPASSNPKEFYRVEPPVETVRKEILNNIDKRGGLNHLDPATVSMVVVEQLPALVMELEGRSLFPAKLLSADPSTLTEQKVSEAVPKTSEAFWQRLYNHFTQLMKYQAMLATEIGEMFGPWLVHGSREVQATRLVISLLEAVKDEVGVPSPDSTLSSARPVQPPPPPPNQPVATVTRSDEKVTASPRSPPSAKEDDFFDQPTVGTEPLTQTAAYRQLLGNTFTMQKSPEESDSDIENQFGTFTLQSLSHSQKASVVSKSGVAASAPSQVKTQPVVAEKSKSPVPSESDFGGSPLSSPKGYMPTAMELSANSTGISSTFSTGKAAKGPAFKYGDSDTDEEVIIPVRGPKVTTSTQPQPTVEDQHEFDFAD